MSNTSILTKADKIRDHLANERTFLAWIRTSISIIVFGFVVAKFGITLRELLLAQNHSAKESGASLTIGIGFMGMGILLSLLSLLRYRKIMHCIDTEQFKPGNAIILFLGLVTAFFGAIMAIYLVFTARTM